MVTGVTGMHKCHKCYTSCLQQQSYQHTDIWMMSTTTTCNIPCVLYVFYGHSITAEPHCALCVLSTLDNALYCRDCWEICCPVWQQRVFQKVNITFLTYFQQRITMESLCMDFSQRVCVCVFLWGGGGNSCPHVLNSHKTYSSHQWNK